MSTNEAQGWAPSAYLEVQDVSVEDRRIIQTARPGEGKGLTYYSFVVRGGLIQRIFLLLMKTYGKKLAGVFGLGKTLLFYKYYVDDMFPKKLIVCHMCR